MHLLHCRIGSSEISALIERGHFCLHCRIGSSEIDHRASIGYAELHCRIGNIRNANRFLNRH
ncbi:MAG: hypothetical protein BSR46_15960 [Candidatus Dactylopiibacterium carminicum]|nr:MAG: hypothetical protein BSR46_15960 [Candidatus Dactylopiibacterium carminicum]